jgi:hypothetical protein
VLGAEHPDTLMSMANLAKTYMKQYRWDEAAILQAQATDGFVKIYGNDHPYTLDVLANLEHIQSMQLRRLAAVNAKTT